MTQLTERELEIMRLLIEGATNKQVARRIDLSIRSVEQQRQRLMKKLDAESPVQLGYLYAKYEAALAASERVDSEQAA